MNRKPVLRGFIRSYKKEIFILFSLSLLSSGFFLALPFFSRLFVDAAFLNRDFGKFLNLSAWGAAVFILGALIQVTSDVVKKRISIKLKLNLANRFIQKFYSLDLKFFQARSAGEGAYRLSDMESVANLVLEQCPNFFADIFKLLIILGVSLWLNARMTIFLFALSPLFLIHGLYLQRKLKPIYEQAWKYSAELSKKIYEAFSKILIIKAFGLEAHQRRIYLRALIKNIRWDIESFRWIIISSVSSSFLSKAAYGAVTLYGGWLIIKGNLTIGTFAALMLYFAQLGALLQNLNNRFERFGRGMVSLDRFFEIMDIQPGIKDSAGAKEISFIRGGIKFRDVWFGYCQGRPILKGLNFDIPAFSWAAVVGPSGCGKTTLINMILRLYEPWSGEVFLDGLELKQINLTSLRSRTAIVTQQPLLFDVSIEKNIAYGFKGISKAEITEAAAIANIHDFIEQLPEGYNTLAGEDACRLSQGLKQRVALARAIARKPDLLILDEATSSVDSFTEEKIFQALRQTRRGLTTIVISHRLFSVKDADRIYFLKQSGEMEQGSHSELLSESAQYRDLFHNQLDKERVFY